MTPPLPARQRRLERVAGWASLGSAAIHGGLIHEHVQEWWGYGLFFAVATVAQVILALALLTDAINPKDTGPQWLQLRFAVYWLGLLGTLALIVLYLVSRTTGIPWFGPGAGEVEEVAPIDLLAKVFELTAAVALALLVRRHRPSKALSDVA